MTKFTTIIVIVNKSTIYTERDIENLKKQLEPAFEKAYTKEVGSHKYMADLVFGDPQSQAIKSKGTLYVLLEDMVASPDIMTGAITFRGGEAPLAEGPFDYSHDASQRSTIHIHVSLNGEKIEDDKVVRAVNHELGHTGGLDHPWGSLTPDDVKQERKFSDTPKERREVIRTNLMNTDENDIDRLRSTNGNNLTPGQLERIKYVVEKQQPSE